MPCMKDALNTPVSTSPSPRSRPELQQGHGGLGPLGIGSL